MRSNLSKSLKLNCGESCCPEGGLHRRASSMLRERWWWHGTWRTSDDLKSSEVVEEFVNNVIQWKIATACSVCDPIIDTARRLVLLFFIDRGRSWAGSLSQMLMDAYIDRCSCGNRESCTEESLKKSAVRYRTCSGSEHKRSLFWTNSFFFLNLYQSFN